MAGLGFRGQTGDINGRLGEGRPDWGLRGQTGTEGFHWGGGGRGEGA